MPDNIQLDEDDEIAMDKAWERIRLENAEKKTSAERMLRLYQEFPGKSDAVDACMAVALDAGRPVSEAIDLVRRALSAE